MIFFFCTTRTTTCKVNVIRVQLLECTLCLAVLLCSPLVYVLSVVFVFFIFSRIVGRKRVAAPASSSRRHTKRWRNRPTGLLSNSTASRTSSSNLRLYPVWGGCCVLVTVWHCIRLCIQCHSYSGEQLFIHTSKLTWWWCFKLLQLARKSYLLKNWHTNGIQMCNGSITMSLQLGQLRRRVDQDA